MDTNKKLFLVTLQYQGYVLADDDYDAENFTGNITDNERPIIKVEEVRSNVLRWPGYACIYHAEQNDRDIKIDECFPPQTAELEGTEPKTLGGHGSSALSDLIEQLESDIDRHEISTSEAIARAYAAGADQQLAEDAKWLDHHALNEAHLKTIPVGDLLTFFNLIN